MKKLFVILPIAVIIICGAIWLWNYLTLQQEMDSVINKDYRNSGIDVSVHYGSYVNPNELVYNLTNVTGSKSPSDVFRVLLQFAEQIKEKEFTAIMLEHNGKLKFIIDGSYFNELGREYSFQNPVYTMRTFPSNLKNPDGTQAYSNWTGGLLGVVNEQLEDFNNFHKRWYINDY
ncbi:MAG: hypothetical protein IH618_02400 [Ignavibacteriaceae bacterium]|nr:hypothetical protein [Ignavibacteriaceae bacterium]